MDAEVEDLEAVRRAVTDGPVVTLGWSYLGAVVALHAQRYPSSVRGVVMVSAMAPRQGVAEYHVSDEVIDDYRRRWAEVERHLEGVTDRRERGRLTSQFRMARKEAIDAMRSDPWRFENEWPENRDPVFDRLFDGLEDRDWRRGCEAVTAPVLVFLGLEDGPLAMGRDWADAFPNARLVALEGVGHYPHLEAKDVFDPELSAFLGSIGGPQPRSAAIGG